MTLSPAASYPRSFSPALSQPAKVPAYFGHAAHAKASKDVIQFGAATETASTDSATATGDPTQKPDAEQPDKNGGNGETGKKSHLTRGIVLLGLTAALATAAFTVLLMLPPAPLVALAGAAVTGIWGLVDVIQAIRNRSKKADPSATDPITSDTRPPAKVRLDVAVGRVLRAMEAYITPSQDEALVKLRNDLTKANQRRRCTIFVDELRKGIEKDSDDAEGAARGSGKELVPGKKLPRIVTASTKMDSAFLDRLLLQLNIRTSITVDPSGKDVPITDMVQQLIEILDQHLAYAPENRDRVAELHTYLKGAPVVVEAPPEGADAAALDKASRERDARAQKTMEEQISRLLNIIHDHMPDVRLPRNPNEDTLIDADIIPQLIEKIGIAPRPSL